MATMIKKIEGQSGEGSGDGEKRGRKASKEVRRQQLIEATIDSLAKRGYSETTMADVADGAGLTAALGELLGDPDQRRRRGAAAL